jgi:hypothetical protein
MMIARPTSIVVIHDYRRTRYQPVLALFELIEDGQQFRVLKPRVDVIEALRPGIEAARSAMADYLKKASLAA